MTFKETRPPDNMGEIKRSAVPVQLCERSLVRRIIRDGKAYFSAAVKYNVLRQQWLFL
jgi:hypothetical protein